MSSFRRWYFYVVSAISLQAVTWAVIALLRNLLIPALGLAGPSYTREIPAIAFQISVIIIGLPMYLLHWRWAGRSAGEEISPEPPGLERILYLYSMLGAFLIPLLANADGLLQSLLRLAAGIPPTRPYFDDSLPDAANLVYTATAVLVLSLMITYHARLLRQERRSTPLPDGASLLHRLFIYLFAAVGLVMTATAAANLLQWLILALGGGADLPANRQLAGAAAAALTGLPAWLYFWRQAQSLFHAGGAREQASLLRKVYLYAVIFFSVLATTGALTALLAGFLRRLLDLEPQSGSGMVFSTLVVGAAVWGYHALVLREDTRLVPLREMQAGLRRLYLYLVAGIGLLVLLIGLSGVLGILFQPGDFVVSRQREQLAWFAAMIVSGLIVWLLPWRKIEQEVGAPAAAGISARTANVRRFYLFFFLLLATLTFLIAAVYILSRLLTAVLGEPLAPADTRLMGLAAAYAIMAGAVWLYHGRLLRRDREALEDVQAKRAAAARIVVVDDGDGKLGCLLLDGLRAALPQSDIKAVGLSGSAAARMAAVEKSSVDQALQDADIIVGPWSMAAARAGLDAGAEVEAAIAASAARKLILPRPMPGWEWASGERWRPDAAVREATAKIEVIVSGEETTAPALGAPATIIFLIVATIFILILIGSLLGNVLPLF